MNSMFKEVCIHDTWGHGLFNDGLGSPGLMFGLNDL